jgi:hypothetical protein
LESFGRIRTFQRVTANPNKNLLVVLHCGANTTNRVSLVFAGVAAGAGARRGPGLVGRTMISTDPGFPQTNAKISPRPPSRRGLSVTSERGRRRRSLGPNTDAFPGNYIRLVQSYALGFSSRFLANL